MAAQSAGPREVAGESAASVDGARGRESVLAGSFWNGTGADDRRFRRERGIAVAPGVVGLAGGRFHGKRLGRETIFQTDRDVVNVSAIGSDDAREIAEGSAESIAGARGALSDGRGDDSRLRAGDER